MAIAGLLVQSMKEHLLQVEASIRSIPEMTTYGCHQDQYVVAVAEAPSDRLEGLVSGIETIEGVLSVYTTYVTVEDELDRS